jgi:recombination protein RecA
MSALPLPFVTPSVRESGPPAAETLAGVQARVQAVVATGRAPGTPWRTGVTALDRALGGGIPRGRVTELTGALAVGKTALVRQVAAAVLQGGSWVAWIDVGRTLAPATLAGLGKRLVVIRLSHAQRHRAAWTADLLLRSGVFGLVVLDEPPALSRVHGVRLAQLARERDAACVVLTSQGVGEARAGGTRGSRLAGTLRLRVQLSVQLSVQPRLPASRVTASKARPDDARTNRVCIVVERGGPGLPHQSVEVDRVVILARRVCAHSEIPDRRGVARSARRPWAARGNSSDAPHGADHGTDTGQFLDSGEHPVTWGGIGVGSRDLYGTELPGHPARIAAGLEADPGDRLPLPAARTRDATRRNGAQHDAQHATQHRDAKPDGLDHWSERRLQRREEREQRGIRDWTTYRGRRRAAESTFGRRPRQPST